MSGIPFSNVNNIHVHSMIPEDQKNMTTQVVHNDKIDGTIINREY